MRPRWIVTAIVLAVSPLFMSVGEARASHAPFNVDSTIDEVDAAPGDGICATAGGVCTLRAAIQEANAHPGADVINLPAGIYTLTIPEFFLEGPSGKNAAIGDLDILDDLSIVGASASTTIVQACQVDQKTSPCPAGQGASNRVLDIGGFGLTVTIRDVTIRHGNEIFGGGGAGILNDGAARLELTNVVVSDNHAVTFGIGAGIMNNAGTITLENSTVTGNVADFQGGGIYNNQGRIGFRNSTISNNSATSGGGIFNVGQEGTATLFDSTISGNTAALTGGGIYMDGFGGFVDLNATTVDPGERLFRQRRDARPARLHRGPRHGTHRGRERRRRPRPGAPLQDPGGRHRPGRHSSVPGGSHP